MSSVIVHDILHEGLLIGRIAKRWARDWICSHCCEKFRDSSLLQLCPGCLKIRSMPADAWRLELVFSKINDRNSACTVLSSKSPVALQKVPGMILLASLLSTVMVETYSASISADC